jgi:hypothetical protein
VVAEAEWLAGASSKAALALTSASASSAWKRNDEVSYALDMAACAATSGRPLLAAFLTQRAMAREAELAATPRAGFVEADSHPPVRAGQALVNLAVQLCAAGRFREAYGCLVEISRAPAVAGEEDVAAEAPWFWLRVAECCAALLRRNEEGAVDDEDAGLATCPLPETPSLQLGRSALWRCLFLSPSPPVRAHALVLSSYLALEDSDHAEAEEAARAALETIKAHRPPPDPKQQQQQQQHEAAPSMWDALARRAVGHLSEALFARGAYQEAGSLAEEEAATTRKRGAPSQGTVTLKMNAALSYLRANELDKAARLIDSVLQSTPKSDQVELARALLRVKRGKGLQLPKQQK